MPRHIPPSSIGIVGLGAIGGAVAARLLAARARDPRGALARSWLGFAAGSSANAGLIRARGLALQESASSPFVPLPLGDARVGAALPPLAEGARYQTILLCTRAEATGAALEEALPLLADDGVLVCLQNGLPEARAAARLLAHHPGSSRAQVQGAVIGWSASLEGPGRVRLTGRGGFLLGANDCGPNDCSANDWDATQSDARLARTAALLRLAFPVRITGNLVGARWSKLVLNCAISTLGAVSGLSFGELARDRRARSLALACIAEGVEVARAEGVQLARISGLDPRWLADAGGANLTARLARPWRHALFWVASRQRPRQRSGMLERLLAGRSSGQVDDLNGAVVAAARAHGLRAPLHERLLARVHAIERGEARIGPHAFDELASR